MTSNALPHLSPRDWDLVREQAVSAPFRRGDIILEEGSHRRALMLLRSGSVRVERAEQGAGITIAQLGAGEIFGEMGFVENTLASGSVIAETDCVVDIVEADALQSVMASEPGFAIRFYHSLAVTLARRLRLTSARLSRASATEAAQVNRFRAARTGNISARQVPPALTAGLDRFERTMLAASQRMRAGSDGQDEVAAEIARACDDVLALLQQFTAGDSLIDMGLDDLLAFRDPAQIEAGIGDTVFRETFPIFMLSATMARCYAKPLGFPDDHETMATIYRHEPEGDGRLGPLIDAWFLDRPICRSRRASRDRMRSMLDETVRARASAEPVRIASLASGAAAELFDLCRSDVGARVRAACVDLDADALLAAAARAADTGLAERMTFLQGNVVPVEGEDASLVQQDVAYALGLCDYLTDAQIVALLDQTFDTLFPDGVFIFTNLAETNPDRHLMEHVLDWQVHHRSRDGLDRLVAQSRFAGRQRAEIVADETGVTLFVRCEKRDA